MKTIKQARKDAGLTQANMSFITGIPVTTIQSWEAFEDGRGTESCREPSRWVKALVISRLENLNTPVFSIKNEIIERYAECCNKFSIDTKDWIGLDEYSFYTTNGSGWEETSDNACDGILVDWAFHLSDLEIKMQSAERFLECFFDELQVGIDDEWSLEQFKSTINKYLNF